MKLATLMQYSSQYEYKSTPGVIKDIFNSENYKKLKSKYVKIEKRHFGHQYFNDPNDTHGAWPVY